MNLHFLVLQSVPAWHLLIRGALSTEFPKAVIFCTDSFDQAIDSIPKDGHLIVITSVMYHDEVSDYRKEHKPTINDDIKTPELLAGLVLQANRNTHVFVFSEYSDAKTNVTIPVYKNPERPKESIQNLITEIKKIL